jgi:hypothetical protein
MPCARPLRRPSFSDAKRSVSDAQLSVSLLQRASDSSSVSVQFRQSRSSLQRPRQAGSKEPATHPFQHRFIVRLVCSFVYSGRSLVQITG